MVPLAKLTPLADNPRSHTTRGIDFIASSLDRVGAARSGVIDEKRVILAGNGMRQAAVQAGYRDAIVVRVDGTRPVFVQRANLSPPQKSRVIIGDNRASELSGWNARLLDYAERDLSIQAEWTAPEWRAAVGPRPVTEGRTDLPWCINTGKSLIPLTLRFLAQKRNLLIPLELSRVMHQGIATLAC